MSPGKHKGEYVDLEDGRKGEKCSENDPLLKDDNDANLRAKRSWDTALAPIKQAPMNLFIMYMSGRQSSSLEIASFFSGFSIIVRNIFRFFRLL